MKQITITMPFEAEGPGTALEPGTQKTDMNAALDRLMWLRESGPQYETYEEREKWLAEEIETVITSAAGLYALRAGSMAACLETAIIWARG